MTIDRESSSPVSTLSSADQQTWILSNVLHGLVDAQQTPRVLWRLPEGPGSHDMPTIDKNDGEQGRSHRGHRTIASLKTETTKTATAPWQSEKADSGCLHAQPSAANDDHASENEVSEAELAWERERWGCSAARTEPPWLCHRGLRVPGGAARLPDRGRAAGDAAFHGSLRAGGLSRLGESRASSYRAGRVRRRPAQVSTVMGWRRWAPALGWCPARCRSSRTLWTGRAGSRRSRPRCGR